VFAVDGAFEVLAVLEAVAFDARAVLLFALGEVDLRSDRYAEFPHYGFSFRAMMLRDRFALCAASSPIT
jgi:hypothetical protein